MGISFASERAITRDITPWNVNTGAISRTLGWDPRNHRGICEQRMTFHLRRHARIKLQCEKHQTCWNFVQTSLVSGGDVLTRGTADGNRFCGATEWTASPFSRMM